MSDFLHPTDIDDFLSKSTFWLFAYHQGMFAGNVTKIEFVCDLQEE